MLKNLEDWEMRVNAYQDGHYRQAETQTRWHYGLGLPTIVLTTVTASTIFANLQENVSEHTKLFLAAISILSAVMSAIQTFYSHAKRAEHNRAIAASLGAARREIDLIRTFPPKNEKEARKQLKELNKKINEIAKDAPVIHVSDTGPTGGGGGRIMLSP